jgi:hypothetical protein
MRSGLQLALLIGIGLAVLGIQLAASVLFALWH